MKGILTAILIFVSFVAAGQDYSERGDMAWAEGNYAGAEIQYNAAKALLDSKKVGENTPEYLFIERKLVLVQRTIALKVRADELYSAAVSGQDEQYYHQAAATYSEILEINPDDPVSMDRKRKCLKWIEAKEQERRLEESRAAQERQQKAAASRRQDLLEGLGNPDIPSQLLAVKNYISRIPDGNRDEAYMAQSLIHYITEGITTVSEDNIPLYNMLGDLYVDAGRYSVSKDLYDCSASLADPEGLYKKAMIPGIKGRQDILYLLLASRSGYMPATEELERYDVTLDSATVTRLGFEEVYLAFSTYRNNPESALYLYFALKNEDSGFEHCDIDITRVLNDISPEQLKSWLRKYCPLLKQGDLLSWFYSVGQKYMMDGNDSLAIKLIRFAADEGNRAAAAWLAKRNIEAGLVDNVDFSAILAEVDKGYNYEIKSKRAFVNYLKGDDSPYLFGRAYYGVEYMGFDTNVALHEQLLLCTLDYVHSKDNYDYRKMKRFLKDNSFKVWDADIVRKCIEICDGDKKGLKLLQKLVTAEGIYDRSIIEQFRQFLLSRSGFSGIYYDDKADGEIYSCFGTDGKIEAVKKITTVPVVKSMMHSFWYKAKF